MGDIVYPPTAAGRAEKWARSLQKYLPASREGSESASSSEDPCGDLGDHRRGWEGSEGCWPRKGRPHRERGTDAGEGITSTGFDEYKDSGGALPLVKGVREESWERVAADASRSILWVVLLEEKPPKRGSKVVFKLH